MALITTNISTRVDQFPYAPLPGDPAGIPVMYPSREIRCLVNGQAVAATGAGDNSFITQTIQLPRNQAYALTGIGATIRGSSVGVAVGFAESLRVGFTNGFTSADAVFQLELFSHAPALGEASGYFSRTYSDQGHFRGILRPVNSTEGCSLLLTAYDATANDQAYVYYFWASLLVFQLEQSRYWAANYPVPIR